jgi:hypothetical protein
MFIIVLFFFLLLGFCIDVLLILDKYNKNINFNLLLFIIFKILKSFAFYCLFFSFFYYKI